MKTEIVFLDEGKITKKRARTFYTKEPDTIKWIDSMPKGSVLYDIGANVGTYAIYAGSRDLRVFAFEPEAANYGLLNRNIQENGLTSVIAYCAAITDHHRFSFLHLSTLKTGGSLHSFDETKDYRLNDFSPVFSQGCIGIPLDSVLLPKPDYIKIDVDGFEHKVLEGGMATIRNAKSVLIELNTNLKEHKEIIHKMRSVHFELVSTNIRTSGVMQGVGNHIFNKKQ